VRLGLTRRRRVAAYGLLRDDERVLLVAEGSGWSLPGGTVEHGESPQATVARLGAVQAGLDFLVGTPYAALADRVDLPGRMSVHHDRLVFAVTATGEPTAPAKWWELPALVGAELTPFTREVLGVDGGAGGALLERDEGWPIERGLALDRSGGRPRVQRFSTYAVATDPDGRVLLTRIARGFPGAGRWHLPGGGTDFGESPTEALLREVREESDQRGEVLALVSVSHRHNPTAQGREGYPIDWHTVRVIYRVRVDDPTVPRVTEGVGGSTESARWFRPGEIPTADLTDFAGSALADAGVR
jgi:8-oxo-dGTP diphosphatase